MKNTIAVLEGRKFKVFGFSDQEVILSSRHHSSFESLLSAVEKSGFTETVEHFPISLIEELSYNEGSKGLELKFKNKKGKSKKKQLVFKKKEQKNTFIPNLASLGDFKQHIETEKKIRPLIGTFFFISLIAGATYWLRNVAISAENGEHLEIKSGKYSGLGQIIINITELIGPTGVLAIGALGGLYMLFLAYKRYTNPTNEITYTKNNPL